MGRVLPLLEEARIAGGLGEAEIFGGGDTDSISNCVDVGRGVGRKEDKLRKVSRLEESGREGWILGYTQPGYTKKEQYR